MSRKSVMILGAGMSGLCAAKRALELDFQVTVYEKADDMGGLWHCKDDVDHVCMYEGLRSNQPRQIMEYPDFHFPTEDQWYFSAKEVQNYLIAYAKQFAVDKVIQFKQQVVEIRPGKMAAWDVTVKNLHLNREERRSFDFVTICNGHFNDPRIAGVKGQELFKGEQIHSVRYRKASDFRGKRVLVIGSGVSAMDIMMQLAKECSGVFFSQRTSFALDFDKPENIQICPVVQELTEKGAVFADGSSCEVDTIIYATGYNYSFPFLHPDCGITVKDNHIHDLYKHCLNVKYPSMAFIGMPIVVLAQEIIDLQSRSCMKYWAGGFELPSKDKMLEELKEDLVKREAQGRSAHRLVKIAKEYHDDLADTAGGERTKEVLHKIVEHFVPGLINNYLNYRNECYEVVDDQTFTTHWK